MDATPATWFPREEGVKVSPASGEIILGGRGAQKERHLRPVSLHQVQWPERADWPRCTAKTFSENVALWYCCPVQNFHPTLTLVLEEAVAEWSKAMALGAILVRGAGSNPVRFTFCLQRAYRFYHRMNDVLFTF